jgi:transposase
MLQKYSKQTVKDAIMKEQNNKIDFSNQLFEIGIDNHKRQWTITILNNGTELKTISIDPSPTVLSNYLTTHYPGGKYNSVYEAGFSGFWIHQKLKQLGINNIVVNPADIPTKNKERINRNDQVDSRKLARELSKGTLEPIYIPSKNHQELRALCRLRKQLSRDTTRLKNRIKSLLLFFGEKIPENHEIMNWSGNFIKYLEAVEFNTEMGKDTLSIYLSELKDKKTKMAAVIKLLKKYSEAEGSKETIKNLMSIPGIGFITAITLYTEIIDIKRFKSLDTLCNFVGLVPSVDSSDQREYVRGISKRHNKYLRNILIESAWVAVRNDPALTYSFNKLCKRMSKQRAIIRIAKKLLNRIKFVWTNNKQYEILKVN